VIHQLTSQESLQFLIERALTSGTSATVGEAVQIVREAIHLAEDVRTLNAWAVKPRGDKCDESWTSGPSPRGDHEWCVCLSGNGGTIAYGPNPEAAIHAAAEAVRKGEI
jgi:hypothetical protein